MEKEHTYRVAAWWASGQCGITKSESAPNAIHFAAPPQFGGLEGRWTPEDLLLSAVASCFTTTFQAIAGYSKFEYTDLEVSVEGTVAKTSTGYCFTRIVLRPLLTIPDEQGQARALELLKKTKSLCLVSRALGIEQGLEPRIEIGKMATVG
ncbi:MAG TPA: OsmC family protein [Terriglobales bacterium]|jgi:organic hydroperoxide reductase OsmC/OhrA